MVSGSGLAAIVVKADGVIGNFGSQKTIADYAEGIEKLRILGALCVLGG